MADEFRKPAGDKLDYLFDWGDWLRAAGNDQIDDSAFSVVPDDSEIDIDGPPAQSNTQTSATVWISGGEVGQTYRIFNTITTVGGRIRTRWINLLINEEA